MPTRNIKQELADPRSSPTIPNTSSRAQTISSTAETPETPIAHDSPMNVHDASPDSQATMANGSQQGHDDHDALRSLGAQSYRLIQGIKKLDQLGISAILPSLPEFIVVGDQSAGKSSIVEALCNISLPRSVGTCTRCPFSITTSAHAGATNDGAWSCSISIEQNSFFENGSFTSLRGKLPPTHFANVTDKKHLEPMLRRAQLAVLNPGANPMQFIDIDLDGAQATRQVAFSPNIVCLDIKGPELPEFSFIDLPGTITNIGEENDPKDKGLVQRIEKLVFEYLGRKKSLVLLACGADQDVETSRTLSFIKTRDATARSVGVLTKADLMPPGKSDYVQSILDGKKFALGKGWFITKQLSQEQIKQGITHTAARELESDFFSSHLWPQGARCGIPQLQEAVSRSLTEHIRGELPEMLGRVESRLSEITGELALYPARPIHPTLIVRDEVDQIAMIISDHVKGGAGRNVFRNAMRAVVVSFRKNLFDAKPSLDYKTPGWKAPSIALDSDDEPETPTPPRTAAMPMRPSATPTSARKRPAADTPSGRQQQRIKRDPAGPAIVKTVYTLEFIRNEYAEGHNSGLPGPPNPEVTDNLILSALEGWNATVNSLIDNAKKAVLNTVQQIVDSQLSNRRSTQLYIKSCEALNKFVEEHLEEARIRISWLCECEQEKPTTLTRLEDLEKKCKLELDLARTIQRVDEHFETREAVNNIKATPREKRVEKASDSNWVKNNLPDDEWDKEVKAVAHIFAYYHTASTCFVDTVAKCLERAIMAPLNKQVKGYLKSELDAENADECARLLAEDPEREKQRTKFLAEQAKLMEAIAELKGLQG